MLIGILRRSIRYWLLVRGGLSHLTYLRRILVLNDWQMKCYAEYYVMER